MRASPHRRPRPSRARRVAGHVVAGTVVVAVLLIAMALAYVSGGTIG